MKTTIQIFCLIIFTCILSKLNAQQNYPQHYFRDPLNIPIQLAANFGELRPDHFHMGLDIRTQSRENLPVFAAADGYISHIKIEKYGYGKAIYIKHPNGYTTLYAHLNSFYDTLERFVKNKQYSDKQWEQDFDLPASMFTVVQGQFIANSGNTGGSAGPHLHFEIRDTQTGNNLNPLLFGLDVPDNIAPVVYSLYWYDRRYSLYTADAQQIAIIKKNGAYKTPANVVKIGSPLVSLGIRMEDLNNTSAFRYGVYYAALFMDDSLLFEFKLNNFSYDDTRYVNACMDYRKWVKSNLGIQYLTVLPGNKLNVFTKLAGDGKILLNDTLQHNIRIEVSDEQQNTSTINFSVQYDSSLNKTYSIANNAFICDVNETNKLQTANANIFFSKNAFYDALPLQVFETNTQGKNLVSSTIHIGDYTIPVHDDYNVVIKANSNLSDALKDKVVMQLKSGNSSTIKKGIWQRNWMLSSFDELGNVQLLLDTVAPAIISAGWKNGSTFIRQTTLIIKCKDDVSNIANFTALLDGNWLMFAKKNDNFIYSFDEHCQPGTHTLIVTATDVAGNVATQAFTITKQ